MKKADIKLHYERSVNEPIKKIHKHSKTIE